MYCGIPENYGCKPVQKVYESGLRSKIIHELFQSFWRYFGSCTVDVRTYIKLLIVCTYALWDTWELWLNACTETIRIGIEVINFPCMISILLVEIRILYRWCTDVHPILNSLNSLCIGPFILYRDAFSHGCTPVHQLYEFELISQISNPLIWSIWPTFASCTEYVRTYSQFQMVCTYVLWDTWKLGLYACTETVRMEIDVTKVPCTISIRLVVIRILYRWCTDVQPITNI